MRDINYEVMYEGHHPIKANERGKEKQIYEREARHTSPAARAGLTWTREYCPIPAGARTIIPLVTQLPRRLAEVKS